MPEIFCYFFVPGSQSQDGPVVLCGAPQGRVHVLNLPTLDEKLHFKYHERDVRAIHNIGGTPSFFATAAMDGKRLNIEVRGQVLHNTYSS